MPHLLKKTKEEIIKEFEKYASTKYVATEGGDNDDYGMDIFLDEISDFQELIDFISLAYSQGQQDSRQEIEEIARLLKRLRGYMNFSSGAMGTNAIYIPPAQQMRNAADEMEAKDALLREVDAFLSKINELK